MFCSFGRSGVYESSPERFEDSFREGSWSFSGASQERRDGSNPAHWRISALLSLGTEQIHELARELIPLPQLTLAAELGQIDWSKLWEIVRVASPETIEIFKRARRMLSLENEKALTGAETLEYLLAAFLSSQPVDAKVLEKVREEADKDLMAEKARCLPEVFEARELAQSLGGGELGASASEEDDSDELLAQALGGATAESHCCSDNCRESKQLTWATPEDGTVFLTRLVNHLKSQYENKRTRFGPDSRHTTKAQKQEIVRRDRWCCATPGCCSSVWLEIHHIKPYSEGGKTLKENLLGLGGIQLRHRSLQLLFLVFICCLTGCQSVRSHPSRLRGSTLPLSQTMKLTVQLTDTRSNCGLGNSARIEELERRESYLRRQRGLGDGESYPPIAAPNPSRLSKVKYRFQLSFITSAYDRPMNVRPTLSPFSQRVLPSALQGEAPRGETRESFDNPISLTPF